jgi:DNA-directed RNA polymerase subunit beta
MKDIAAKPNRLSLSKFPIHELEINLIESQLKSYKWLLEKGLRELFDEVSPIDDYGAGVWRVEFGDIRVGEPNSTFVGAQKKGGSYDASVYVKASLTNLKTGEIKEQEIYLMDLPLMSSRGTFLVNGNERVVVQQIVRAEGTLFVEQKMLNSFAKYYAVKLIPLRGKWYNLEVSKNGIMSVRIVDGRPKIYLTTILKALGYNEDTIRRLYKETDDGTISFIENTLAKDNTKTVEDAVLDIFTKLRPEDSVNLESANGFFNSLFFSKRRFFLGKTGRYQINKKLHGDTTKPFSEEDYLLTKEDIVEAIRALIELNTGKRVVDDIDHLANRRIRGVGELIQEKIRIGVMRMEKNIKDKMSTFSSDDLLTPSLLINSRPVSSSVSQFFGSSEVSRYMDQENLLSEVEAKRRITAAGPGGLTRESATFSVRDVHFSQYSKICPVQTPEGPMVGIVSHMSMYARVNEYGFLESPYRRVYSGKKLDELNIKLKSGEKPIKDRMYVTDIIEYLSPDIEMQYYIAHAGIDIGHDKIIEDDTIFCRNEGKYVNVPAEKINFIDVSPSQIASMALSLVPFAANTDSLRTLMASNMQRQAVPLLNPQAPIVGTGIEKVIARASGRAVFAEDDGKVIYADSSRVVVEYDNAVLVESDVVDYGTKSENRKKDVLKDESNVPSKIVTYDAEKYYRTNQNTCFNQIPVVTKGQRIKKDDLIIQGPAMDMDELALGTNLNVAYMGWNGYNYEDGIILSERVVKEDVLTSIHIKEYVQDIRETKLGDEEVTRDIPNVAEYTLRNLDENGIVRIGAKVGSSDILVGIVAPKGESEVSAEEKLLRVIFGEAARDVRDNSLKMPHGDSGIVTDVQILDKLKGDKLPPGVLKEVKVYVARTHKIGVGDKLTGRFGDKGVVTKVLPVEDMPFMADGTPVDIVLSPLSIVKRMNLGQLKETHIGKFAKELGITVAVPAFAPIDERKVLDLCEKDGIDMVHKVALYDGLTGEKFDSDVVVGVRYFLKLDHLADDKVHARSVGPYTIVTQQPLGGKAQFGGQRFGEMEVWALEAHGVPVVLQEMLATKSDDVVGRVMAYRAIIQGTEIAEPKIPASFDVLRTELMALGLNLEPLEAVVDDTDIGEQLEVGNIVEEVLGNETFDKGSEDSNLLVEENVPENQEEMISLDE